MSTCIPCKHQNIHEFIATCTSVPILHVNLHLHANMPICTNSLQHHKWLNFGVLSLLQERKLQFYIDVYHLCFVRNLVNHDALNAVGGLARQTDFKPLSGIPRSKRLAAGRTLEDGIVVRIGCWAPRTDKMGGEWIQGSVHQPLSLPASRLDTKW